MKRNQKQHIYFLNRLKQLLDVAFSYSAAFVTIVVLMLFFLNKISAQNELPDSNVVLQLIKLENKDSLELALAIAKEIRFEKGHQEALRKLGRKEWTEGNMKDALGYHLTLLNRMERYPVGEEDLILLYDKIAAIYEKENLYDQALRYYRLSYHLCEDETDEKNYLQEIADLHFQSNRIDSALYFQKALLNYYKKEKDNAGILRSEQKMIEIFDAAGDFEKSLDHNKAIQKLLEKLGNKKLTTSCYNNLAYNYNALKNYPKALEYFALAESLNKKTTYLDNAVLYTNTGIVHANLGSITKSINYLKRAEKVYLERNVENEALSNLYHLIATIYLKNGDLYNALFYNIKAGKLAEKKSYGALLGDSYNTSALIYQELYEYEKALEFYKKSLTIKDSLLLQDRLRQQDLLQQQFILERSEKEIKLLLINQEVKDLTITQLELEKENLESERREAGLESERREAELELLKKSQEIKEANFRNSELEKERTQQELELTAQQLLAEKKDREISDLIQTEKMQALEIEKKEADEKKRLQEIELLTKDKVLLTQKQEIADLQIEQQAVFRQSAYAIGGLLALMLLGFLSGFLNAQRKNKRLAQQNTEIENQKKEIEDSRDLIENERVKSESLLLNILPEETAEELKTFGFAKAKQYKQVTVLFTDFSNFTNLVESLSPQEIINELNDYFLIFDEISERHNLEKIKTIGDSFMCAGGIPIANKTNPYDAIKAALEMQQFVKNKNSVREKQGLPVWSMRVGIHTGPVITGVVGSRKFAYDIWGDAVNIASRMETACELGKVNISGATYQLVKDQYNCTHRGAIAAKNKGDIDMYFVENLI